MLRYEEPSFKDKYEKHVLRMKAGVLEATCVRTRRGVGPRTT